MTGALTAAFLATVGLPLLLAAALAVPAGRRAVPGLAVLAPLPGLLAALLAPGGEAQIGWLLFGLRVGFGETGRPVLAAAAAVWLLAALHLRGTPWGDGGRTRFLLFFLPCMAATLGAALVLDRPGFYLFFGGATLASYGLIVTDASGSRRRAGRLYLALALIGELAVLAGLLTQTLGGLPATAALLLYAGFGAKLGILPLHVGLPPAYRAAPPAGAAPLAGPVLTVAVLGWLRFMPIGAEAEALPGPGTAILVLGLAAAFYGAAIGSLQRQAAALLAYSSISQMGILLAALGLALSADGSEARHALAGAALLFAVHHTLAKSALFLGLGAERRRPGGSLVFPALVVLSLSLTGLALTGGALGKLWIEEGAAALETDRAALLATLLPATSVATTLLMARFLWLTRHPPHGARGPAWTVPALTVAALAGPWALLVARHPEPAKLALGTSHLWHTAWPVGLGIALAVAIGFAARGRRRRIAVAPGDIGAPLLRLSGRAWAVPSLRLPVPGAPDLSWLATLPAADLRLRPLAVYGSVLLLLFLVVMMLTTLA